MRGARERGLTVQVFLTDFGLARNVATGSRYTRTGETLGTPAYMSPEQARGELATLTPASDVWALGCVLYEAVAGRRAFEGDSPAAVIGRVLTCPPPRPPGVSDGTAALMRGCLRPRPARRPATAAVLREECGRVLRGRPPRCLQQDRRRRTVAVAGGAALLGVAVAAVRELAGRIVSPPARSVSTGESRADPIEETAAAAWRDRFRSPAAAIDRMESAVARRPDRPDWRVQLGLLYWAAGRDADAVAAWSAVPPGCMEHVRARLYRGIKGTLQEAGGALGEGDAAKDVVWVGVQQGPEARLARALVLTIDREFDLARSHLAGQEGWLALLIRGQLETEDPQGDRALAVRCYRQALESGIELPWVRYNIGNHLLAADDEVGAIAEWRRVLQIDPDHIGALLNCGLAAERQGDFVSARASYDAALDVDPSHATAHSIRGALRGQTGDLEGAERDLKRAIELDSRIVGAHYNLGHLHAARGDLRAACACYTQVLAIDPSHHDALANRAVAHSKLGEIDRAIADGEALVARDPQDWEATNNLGLALSQAGRLRQALAAFDAALACGPDRVGVRLNRARVRVDAGDLDGAIADYRRVLELDPRTTDAHANLGQLHAHRREWVLACRHLQEFLALAPEHALAESLRQLLARCRTAATQR